MTDRQAAAIDAIIQERRYQDTKWNHTTGSTGNSYHTFTEFLVYIDHYVKEAMRVASTAPDSEADIFIAHSMRKIAALSVAAMEVNGVVHRD